MDASGNESDLYSSNSDLYAPYFVFTEEAEIYAEDPYDWTLSNDLFFFLDKANISSGTQNAEVINLDGSPGAYANFSNNVISYNGVTIPSNTILNVDGTTFQIPTEFSDKNSYDYDVEINSTFGNDFINVEGINNDISFRWSPGNDVYFSDLRDDDYQNAEFVVGNHYNYLV